MNTSHRATDFPVLYINLERDTTKKNIIEKNLKGTGFRFNRIDAIYGKKLYDKTYLTQLSKLLKTPLGTTIPINKLHANYWLNRSNFKTMSSNADVILPKVGCFLSHLLAIKTAIDKNYDSVLILEDDSAPLKNINERFIIPNDADIYYLGGSFFHQNDNRISNKNNHILINTDDLKLCGTFAYIIPSKAKIYDMYNLLMSTFNDDIKSRDSIEDWGGGHVKLRAQAIDFMYINHCQKNGICYIANPVKFTHEEMGSNIVENRSRYDLKFFYTDLQKKQLLNK